MNLLTAITFGDFIPLIVALLGAGGILGYLKWRKIAPAQNRNTEAQTEKIMAEVADKKAETQIRLYENAMKLVDHLNAQLSAAEKRENLLQQRLTNVQAAYDMKIGELQNALDFEKAERLKVQQEVVKLRRQLEEKGGPRGDVPR